MSTPPRPAARPRDEEGYALITVLIMALLIEAALLGLVALRRRRR